MECIRYPTESDQSRLAADTTEQAAEKLLKSQTFATWWLTLAVVADMSIHTDRRHEGELI